MRLCGLIMTVTVIAGSHVVSGGGGVAHAAPVPISPAEWTAVQDGDPKYPGIHTDWDIPIQMDDGVVLKANVYRPADDTGAPIDDPSPVILNLTPYTKLVTTLVDAAVNAPVLGPLLTKIVQSINLSGTPISGISDITNALRGGIVSSFAVDRKLIRSGYTQIVVDVRGTGFSQGTWDALSDREQQDTVEVVDWAKALPYSNGRIGMNGISYSANNQFQAAANGADLGAIFPVEAGTNLVNDIVAPGGGLGVTFLSAWLAAVNSTKWVPNVASMLDGTFDWKWLADRMADPLTLVPEMLQAIGEGDADKLSPDANDLVNPNSALRKSYVTDMAAITTPTMAVGQWHDLFTNAEWRTLDALSGVQKDSKKLVMGGGFHANVSFDMGLPGGPPRLDVLQRTWFDRWLKDVDNGIDEYAPATLFQIGNGWIQDSWFPAERTVEYRRSYLTPQPSGVAGHAVEDGSLSAEYTNDDSAWTVTPGLASLCSNDASQAAALPLIFGACYSDNRIAESQALTFTSQPVAEATRISGPINVHLNASSDGSDGYWVANITDVSPDGNSQVISSGQVMTSLRDFDEQKTQYSPNGDVVSPYYEMSLPGRETVTPGTAVQLELGTHATDALLAPGHRLRVSISALNLLKGIPFGFAAADSRYLPQHIVFDPDTPSWVTVPSDRKIE